MKLAMSATQFIKERISHFVKAALKPAMSATQSIKPIQIRIRQSKASIYSPLKAKQAKELAQELLNHHG